MTLVERSYSFRIISKVINMLDRKLLTEGSGLIKPWIRWSSAIAGRPLHSGIERQTQVFWVADSPPLSPLFLAHPARLSRYRKGVENSILELAASYSLSDRRDEIVSKIDGGVVVDCGAHIGELGIYFGPKISYFAFEPDPEAFKALLLNLNSVDFPDAEISPLALSDNPGMKDFFLKSNSADSSLIPPNGGFSRKISVDVIRLDTFVREKGLPSIDLLKIEAEGAEPEVLTGSLGILDRVRYLAFDVGPERDGRDTLAAVLEILNGTGFRMIDSCLSRGRVLFSKE